MKVTTLPPTMPKITEIHRAPCPACQADTLHVRYKCTVCDNESAQEGQFFWQAETQHPHGRPFVARGQSGIMTFSGWRAFDPGEKDE